LANRLTVLFPEDVCNSRYWGHFGELGVHLGAGNWRQSSGGYGHGIMRFLEARWFEWMRKKQVKASLERGPKRTIGEIKHENKLDK
jgi:hypothetical protein